MGKKEDDYVVLFKGAKLSKQEANQTGVAIIVAIIAAVLVSMLPIADNKAVAYPVILVFAILGFWVGTKIFPSRKNK